MTGLESPGHFRVTKGLMEKLVLISATTGLRDARSIVGLAVDAFVEDLAHKRLPKEVRLRVLQALVEDARRHEEGAFKARRSMLRSHPSAYLSGDLSGSRGENEEEIKTKDPLLGEAIDGVNALRAYWAERIAELHREIARILREEDNGSEAFT